MATSSQLEGYVDYRGYKITVGSRYGGWKSAILVLGMEIAEAFACYGISSNLINYLTGSLHISTADAAEKVNLFTGVSHVLPLLGAFVADSYLGRYKTILFATILSVTALVLISLSAGLHSLLPPDYKQAKNIDGSCDGPSQLHSLSFFLPLYLFALGHGGFKPSAQAFGADQFDATESQERKGRSSFFTWLYFGMNLGIILGVSSISYAEEQFGWGVAFGIPCFFMVLGFIGFLLGSMSYRYGLKRGSQPLTWLVKDLMVVACKRFETYSSSFNPRKCNSGVDETSLLHDTNQSEGWILL